VEIGPDVRQDWGDRHDGQAQVEGDQEQRDQGEPRGAGLPLRTRGSGSSRTAGRHVTSLPVDKRPLQIITGGQRSFGVSHWHTDRWSHQIEGLGLSEIAAGHG